MIIHICGSSGSGKTYIGNLFKNKINVIDLDDWTEEFNKKTLKTKKTFMSFIDEKLKKLNDCLLVGYLDVFIQNKIIIYDIDTPYKFFIKIPLKQLFKQYNSRIVKIICKNKNDILDVIEKNNYDALPVFKTINELKNIYEKDVENYKNLGYKMLNQDKIIKCIDNII
jgi:adenylate kinase family enzyme